MVSHEHFSGRYALHAKEILVDMLNASLPNRDVKAAPSRCGPAKTSNIPRRRGKCSCGEINWHFRRFLGLDQINIRYVQAVQD